MLHPSIRREIAERHHRALPEEIRSYLKGRGIPATIIERYLLGWNGERITIPIFGRGGEILGFRYAKSPIDTSNSPKMLNDLGFGAELYGWDALMREPKRVVICEGEFDRLVLEANGFPAVTSTAGAQTFRKEWLPYFEDVKHVYICFDRDLPGITAAKQLQRLIPRARIATLPADVGEKGDVTNFFVDLGRTRLDFEMLLASAKPLGDEDLAADQPPVENVRAFRPAQKVMKKRADKVKRAVRLAEIAESYTHLRAEGSQLVGHCPFHDDREPSFTVYPATDTYYCFGCGAHGDVLKLVMDKESMTFGQALAALERFQYTHELYGTDS
jgi:DNA primase